MNEDNKVSLFTVIGFILLVIFLAWLAVQVVRLAPVAFSLLADTFNANQVALREKLNDENNTENQTESDEVVEPELNFDEAEVVEDEEEIADNDEVVTGTVSTTTTTNTPQVTTAPVQYRTVTTYKIPESDPNGFVDLQVSFLAVGHLNSSGRFVASNSLEEDTQGAMQFIVKNIGTKTSNVWSFIAELPDQATMNSKLQNPLKPAESSMLTLVFEVGDRSGTKIIGATALGGGDNKLTNNGFRQTVEVR